MAALERDLFADALKRLDLAATHVSIDPEVREKLRSHRPVAAVLRTVDDFEPQVLVARNDLAAPVAGGPAARGRATCPV